jgi:hypothetical protein
MKTISWKNECSSSNFGLIEAGLPVMIRAMIQDVVMVGWLAVFAGNASGQYMERQVFSIGTCPILGTEVDVGHPLGPLVCNMWDKWFQAVRHIFTLERWLIRICCDNRLGSSLLAVFLTSTRFEFNGFSWSLGMIPCCHGCCHFGPIPLDIS